MQLRVPTRSHRGQAEEDTGTREPKGNGAWSSPASKGKVAVRGAAEGRGYGHESPLKLRVRVHEIHEVDEVHEVLLVKRHAGFHHPRGPTVRPRRTGNSQHVMRWLMLQWEA